MIQQQTRLCRSLSLLLALLFAAFISMPLPAIAQTDQGRIVGTVVDATGAVVPGATVTVRNERTGEERSATTNDEGLFLISALKPSLYTVTAAATNFDSATANSVQISVGQELTLNLTLNTTGVSASIDVVGTSEAAIDTGSAKIGANVNEREVKGLPLNGRQVSQLYLQAPGSVNSGSGTFGDIRFSGRAVEQNIVRFDGIEGTAIIDTTPGNINGEVPSPFRLQSSLENIQEFRVDSSNYPAEFGTGTGGQISVVTKSGGNRFSGSLFEYLRNDALDARNFFDVAGKSPLRLNQFGGSLGGPIVKDKAFFFFSYEGYRARFGINSIEAAPALRFAQAGALAPNGAAVNAGIQPLIAAFRSPDASIRIPASATGDPNFDVVQLQSRASVNEDAFAARFDYRFNDTNTIYARFFRDDGDNISPEGVTGRNTAITAVPQNGVISYQSVLSPKFINEFKFGYNSAKTRVNGIAPTINGIDLSALTINISGQVASPGIPGQGTSAGVAVPGGLVRANSATNGRGQPYTPYSLSFIDNFNYTTGNHNARFGGEIRAIRLYTDRQGGTTYTFANLNSFLTNTPSSIQFLGDVNAPSVFNGGATGERLAKQNYYIAYAQDEWKIRPNFTLNYGLRYEYYTPLREDRDLQVLFDIRTGQLRDPREDAYRSSKNNFGPRVAFTYSPNIFRSLFGENRATVLRGGVGIYYGPGQTEDQIQPIESDRIASTISNSSVTPLVFPVNTAAIISNFINTPTNRTFQPRAYSSDYEIPERVYQYSFSVQQELPYNLVGTVAYVGSQGRNLFLRSVANKLLPGQSVIASSANSLPAGVGVVNRTNAAGQVTGVSQIREFSIVNGTTVSNPFAEVDYKTSGGSDSYNALQTSLARRFQNGLTLNSQYTFGRSYGNTAGSNEARTSAQLDNFEADRSYNNFDVRHSFNFSAIYALPFGSNQRYDLGSIGNAIFGNFEVGTIINARSGLPIEVNIVRPDVVVQCVAAPCAVGAVAQLPSGISSTTPLPAGYIAVVNTPGGGNSRNLRRPNIVPGESFYLNNDRNLINPAAFTAPAPGEFGNLPRNALRGTNFNQFDIVLNKRFALTEGVRLDFRTEIFNLFNHTNFALPGARLNLALPTLNLTTGALNSGVQPGQAYTQAAAGSTFGVLTSTVERTVGLGTNRQIQFALRLNF